MDRNEALARTENTRRLASEGWNAGYGGPPISPHQWATQANTPNPLSGVLWNMGTAPASVLDTTLRTARGAYLGGLGGVAGPLSDADLESNPDALARALPEYINVLEAATAQPELKFLPRFPVSTATRFAVKHPVEAVAGTVEPYLINRPMDWAMKNVVPEDAGSLGGRLTQPTPMGVAAAPGSKALKAGVEPKPPVPPVPPESATRVSSRFPTAVTAPRATLEQLSRLAGERNSGLTAALYQARERRRRRRVPWIPA